MPNIDLDWDDSARLLALLKTVKKSRWSERVRRELVGAMRDYDAQSPPYQRFPMTKDIANRVKYWSVKGFKPK